MRAARLLGISRGALRYRMRQYGIERPSRNDLVRLSGPLSQGTNLSSTPLASRGWRRIESLVDSQDAKRHSPTSQAQPGLEPRWEQRLVAVLAISLTFPAADGLAIPHNDPWTVVAHWGQFIVRQLTGFGGIILQRSPLMFIAAFGVHGNPEQLPQHAVEAALAIRRSVSEMSRSDAREIGVEVRMAVHQGIALVNVKIRKSAARVLPTADMMTLTLRLLGDAVPGEILLSPHVGHLVEGWYELQAGEVLLGDRTLDRVSAYAAVSRTVFDLAYLTSLSFLGVWSFVS